MKAYTGTIVTCDRSSTVARWLVEDAGRILHVGDTLPEAYAEAPRVELGDQALLPAFADTHLHFSAYALMTSKLDVRDCPSVAAILEMTRAWVGTHADPVVLGFGASPHNVPEGRLPRRDELDRVCPDRPIFLVKYDGHACIVNSKLLAELPASIRTMRGFHEESGEMNQEAYFAVSSFVTNRVSILTLLRAMLAGIDRMAARGIAMMHTVEGVGFPRDLEVDLIRHFARALAQPFQTRIYFQTMETAKVLRRKLPRIGGCFATALDGCFGSEDAALLEPYASTPSSKGVLFYSDEQVAAFCKSANRAGLQIEMHAIGDAAFDQAVQALVAALAEAPRPDHRHTIIHACLPTPAGLDLCAKHGIAIAVQPAFIDWAQEPLAYLERLLGQRAHALNPLADMVGRGLVLSGGSDAPCTLPDPIAGIHAACNHAVPEQSVSIQEALKMFTYNAAWMSFDEKERGSLETGKVADMVRLNRNPLTMPRSDLKQLRIDELLLRGEPYVPGQGLASLATRMLTRPLRAEVRI